MGLAVGSGAMLTCAFGVAPGTLTVLPIGRVNVDGVAMANIMDHQPNVNIAPFGMCTTLSNPQVASATSAAQGVLTPQPCIPVTTSPWSPGSPMIMVAGQPALTNSSICQCAWGGAITITNPGVVTVQVP
jgi:hypothetical protein